MKPGNLQQINQQLQRKTGVDFARYLDPELVDAIGNAITFPLFLARSLSRPTGFMLLLLLVAFVLTDSAYFRGFLTFPGFLLAVINGIHPTPRTPPGYPEERLKLS